jgi:hypothetical protein
LLNLLQRHRSGIRPDLTSGMLALERFSDPNEWALPKHRAGVGDHLPDLVAAISGLRHSLTFAAPGAVVVLSNVRAGSILLKK